MDTGSSHAVKGFTAQSHLSLLLRTSLPSEFEVFDSRPMLYQVGYRKGKLNFEEKKTGDIRIIKDEKEIALIEVCCGSYTGVSIGQSKFDHFDGTHYCFMIPSSTLGDTVRYGDIVFAPRDTMTKYLGTIPLKESKMDGHESYRWLTASNLRGLRCGSNVEQFVEMMKAIS